MPVICPWPFLLIAQIPKMVHRLLPTTAVLLALLTVANTDVSKQVSPKLLWFSYTVKGSLPCLFHSLFPFFQLEMCFTETGQSLRNSHLCQNQEFFSLPIIIQCPELRYMSLGYLLFLSVFSSFSEYITIFRKWCGQFYLWLLRLVSHSIIACCCCFQKDKKVYMLTGPCCPATIPSLGWRCTDPIIGAHC